MNMVFQFFKLLPSYKTMKPAALSARISQLIQRHSTTRDNSSGSESVFRNIEVKSIDRVRTIGLNRPQQRNAVDRQTARELHRAFRLFDDDDSSDVAVLYGEGGTFCAGYDLKELAAADTENGSLYIEEFLQECAVDTDIGPMVTTYFSSPTSS